MKKSISGRYILTVKFGNRKVHGLKIYGEKEVLIAKQNMLNVGAKYNDIIIDTYESIYKG